MSYPQISIVVAAYNSQDTIGACIKSLLDLDYPEKEIIVVDDGSTDKTAEIASNYSVKVIRKEQGGVSSARNIGVETSKGEILAFTDGDCVVDMNWLKRLVEHFKDEEVGGVGGRVIFLVGDALTTAIAIEYEERFEKRGENTQSIACINAAFRRHVFNEVGGFKRILGEDVGGEDIEFSYRVKEAGYRLVYEPQAEVSHDHRTMASSFMKRNYRNAVVSVQNYIKYRRAFADSFFNPGLILQPLIFSMLIVSGFLSLFFAEARSPFLGLFLASLLWNVPLVVKTCRRNRDYSAFPYLSVVFFLRGVLFAFGMVQGVMRVIRNLFGTRVGI
ncbi:MAG: glycosyltransferase [Thermoplasmata archaeon]